MHFTLLKSSEIVIQYYAIYARPSRMSRMSRMSRNTRPLEKDVDFYLRIEYHIKHSFLMPHGVMVAQLTLDQFVKVRILMRQPSCLCDGIEWPVQHFY